MNRKSGFKRLIWILLMGGFFSWVRDGDSFAASVSCSGSRSQTQSPLCTHPHQNANLPKITFDLKGISPEGLVGQKAGLRSQSYEFCIPDQAPKIAEVKAIDPSLRLYRSRGRMGCRTDQWLAIGETHQPRWQQILLNLAQLDYIERIDPFWGE